MFTINYYVVLSNMLKNLTLNTTEYYKMKIIFI